MTLSAECLVEEAIRAAMRKEPAAEFQRWATAWLSGANRSGWQARRAFRAIPELAHLTVQLALRAAWTLAESEQAISSYTGYCRAQWCAEMALYYAMPEPEPA